ncbi:MAG: zinc ribbon domain-containing protein [Chloroflexi bacterium]|nr:zinc ribbon domain-containing protein [Chloroflexota bacterium]
MEQGLAVLGAIAGGTIIGLFWLSLIIWTYRDIHDRTRDLSMQVLSVFLVMAFSLFGILLYLILRPRETMDEAYVRSLEEEALLRDIGEEAACPSCRRFVERDFLVCPYCQTQLREGCTRCERLLNFAWVACPYCGTAKPAPAPPVTAAPSTTRKGARQAKAEETTPSGLPEAVSAVETVAPQAAQNPPQFEH